MPDFTTLTEDEVPSEEPPSIPIEDVDLTPEDVVVPTFTESSYNFTPDEDTIPIGEPQDVEAPESAPPKRRGRPKGSRNRAKSDVPLENPNIPLTSALRRKTDQELSRRAQGILIGATKIPSVINPHIEMREDEAQAIADPLVSYAKAHVDSERIEQFVEQWDLIAVGIASAAYGMRVVKETRDDPNIGVRRVPRASRPRVVEPLPVSPDSTGPETFQQGTGYSGTSEDVIASLPPSEPIIGNL